QLYCGPVPLPVCLSVRDSRRVDGPSGLGFRDYTLRGGRGNGLPGLGAFDLAVGSALIPRLRSLDQQSTMAFHSPPAWRLRTTRYLPRSSRRLPMANGTSILQRPAS